MSESNSFSHLTLEERRIILTGIMNGSTKTAIAQTIGKDKSTVGKEIKLRRTLTHKCKMPLECNNYRKCPFNRQCTLDCPEYEPFHCSRRDRTPGACNGCSNWTHCRFDKYQYCPEDAQKDYRNTLMDSREGVNLTSLEAKAWLILLSLYSNRDSPLFRLLQTILNLASAKRRFTTTLKIMFSTRLQELRSWICAVRYHAGFPKKIQWIQKTERTQISSRTHLQRLQRVHI